MTTEPTTKQEEEHNTDSKECWCNPKLIYIPESDSYVIVHNTLLPDDTNNGNN